MGQALFTIAGVPVPSDVAVCRLLWYPSLTPQRYDLTSRPAEPLSHADLLKRTRFLNSRLSNRERDEMVERSESAPWESALESANLVDLVPGSREWEAADRLYLDFHAPKIKGVSFAKVHKFLHLVYPNLYPIIDGRVRKVYREVQRQFREPFGVSAQQWRRRTWLAIARDVREARASGAFDTLRSRLAVVAQRQASASPDTDRTSHAERVALLSDLRLLDMLTWASSPVGGSACSSLSCPAHD